MATLLHRRKQGFTLIELMISVAIIGILAAVAIPGFQLLTLRSKRAEATANLGAIRKVQLAYFSQQNAFLVAPTSPAMALDQFKQNWQIARPSFSSIPNVGFDTLGFTPEGATFYDYDINAAQGPNGWSFTAAAYGDVEGDGNVSVYMYVHPDNAGNTIPNWLGGWVVPFDRNTCQPLLKTVAIVPARGACGFPTSDDY